MSRLGRAAVLVAAAATVLPAHGAASDTAAPPGVVTAPATADPAAGAAAPATGEGLTLDDLWRIASGASERLGLAREDVVQSELARRTAISRVLPSVSLESTYNIQNSVSLPPPSGTAGSAFTFADTKSEGYLKLTQPIFSGLRERNYLAYTNEAIASSRLGAKEAERLLYRDLAAAFYSALQAEANVATLVDTAALGRRRLDEVRARNEVGLARRTEVLLVESQLAADESSLVRARNDAAVAKDLLARLAGTPIDRPLQDTLELPAGVGAGADGGEATAAEPAARDAADRLESEALLNRSDLLALERDVEAARRLVSFSRGEYFPVIDLEADWFLWRKNYSTFQQETDWAAQVNFTFPLFQGGRIRASVATAQSRLRQAELRRAELEREIRQEVRAAALLVSTDAGLLRTAEARVASADENLRLVSEEYRNDLATNLEVYSAQNQLLAGRLELDRQRNQLKLDWLALRTSQGLLPAGSPP